MRCHCASPLVPGAKARGKNDTILEELTTRFHAKGLREKRDRIKTATQVHVRGLQGKADAMALTSLGPGQIIGGCYRLERLAGQGGMGAVYRAKHSILGRDSAIKFLAPSLVSQENWLLFQKEAKLISSLSHGTICQVYDLGIHEGNLPFYVMDFVNGSTLDEILTRQGPLSVGATIELYLLVLDGVAYAHRRGVIHKDLKPANIMLTGGKSENGSVEEVHVKILDFGISDLNEKQNSLQTSLPNSSQNKRQANDEVVIVGSASYMSPEQFRGRDIDQRSDIYNLGCCIFETLTGNPPFAGQSFEDYEAQHIESNPPTLSEATGIKFPPALEAIVKKSLDKAPHRRYQLASELAVDLKRLLDHKALQFAQEEDADYEEPEPPAQRGGLGIIAIAVSSLLILGLVGILIFYVFFSGKKDPTSSAFSMQDPRKMQPIKANNVFEVIEPDFGKEQKTPSDRIKQNIYTMPAIHLRPDKNNIQYDFIDSHTFAITTPTGKEVDAQGKILPADQGILLLARKGDDYANLLRIVTMDRVLGMDTSQCPEQRQIIVLLGRFTEFIRYFKFTADDTIDSTMKVVSKCNNLKILHICGQPGVKAAFSVPFRVSKLYLTGLDDFMMRKELRMGGEQWDSLTFIQVEKCHLSRKNIFSLTGDAEGELRIIDCTFEANPMDSLRNRAYAGKTYLELNNPPEDWINIDNLIKTRSSLTFNIKIKGWPQDRLDALKAKLKQQPDVTNVVLE